MIVPRLNQRTCSATLIMILVILLNFVNFKNEKEFSNLHVFSEVKSYKNVNLEVLELLKYDSFTIDYELMNQLSRDHCDNSL